MTDEYTGPKEPWRDYDAPDVELEFDDDDGFDLSGGNAHHMDDDRYKKLCDIQVEDRVKLVFEWVKTGVVTLKEFQFICEELLHVDPFGS
jgi:hypothetical protein